MARKTKKRQNLTQLSLMLIGIILISYISSFVFVRFDLTSEKRFTLSETTVNQLDTLKEEVYVQIYLDGENLSVGMKKMKSSIKELLDEFRVYAGNNISYEFINPSENNDKKIRFNTYKELYKKGLVPIESTEEDSEGKTSQKIVFPGAIVIHRGQEMAVNLLKSNLLSMKDPMYHADSEENLNKSIQALEYEFTNAITKLSKTKQPQIAFIEGHGELSEKALIDVSTALSEYYTVKRGAIGGRADVLSNFEAVIIAKPTKEFSKKDKFALDQYIMNGGKVVWLIDAIDVNMDSLRTNGETIAFARELNLTDQLFHYGVRVNPDLLQDMRYAPIRLVSDINNGKPQFKLFPWIYSPLITNSNKKHPITKYMNAIRMDYVSSIDTVGESPNIKKTILLKTSRLSHISRTPIKISLDIVRKNPNAAAFDKPAIPVAVLLEGEFESAFKNQNTRNLITDKAKVLKTSKPTKMVVVSDGDFLLFDNNTQQLFPGAKDFIVNTVNFLCDENGLMQLRSREFRLRLLDKEKIRTEKSFWQIINTVFPIIIIIIFGIILYLIRKRRYTNF